MTLHRVLFLTVALMIAVATAMGARSWVSAERAAAIASIPVPSQQPSNKVLVAAKELVPGSFVKAENLKWQAWPKDGVQDAYVVKGAKGKAADFTGAVVRTRLLAGQPITAQGLVQPGERGFMAAVLTPGMRAVSVPVNATSGIAGFVFPGDKVDVILTLRLPSVAKEKRLASQTLLNDVRILAMDQIVENADGKASVAKTATLEVSTKQAEHVALALQMGNLSLSLRSLAHVDAPTSVVRVADVDSFTLDREIMFMRKQRKAASGGQKVTILRGGKAESAKF